MKRIIERARALDAADPIAPLRSRFHLPDGMIYLDGNSLGMMPRIVIDRLRKAAAQEWANGLIRSWDGAGWIRLPLSVGDRIAPLVGAGPGEIAVGDSTSVNLFKCLSAALKLQPGRRVILAERDNFPTDIYIAEGLSDFLGDVTVRFFNSTDPIESHLDSNVAVLLLSHVHYRSARLQDLDSVTRVAHAAGALVLWDLSHSVGAVKVHLTRSGADFAVGCTYKYLNGGPGAPAFTWAAPRLANVARQALSGWMGHSDPFSFAPGYHPGLAIKRFICGTPQVLSLSALDEALKLWSDVDLDLLFEKSRKLTEFFIELVEAECGEFGPTLQSPRNPEARGSHVSYGFEHGYPVMQALAQRGVVGDFRSPDTMRFGFAPLYVSYSDVARAVEILHGVLAERSWRAYADRSRAAVT